MMDYEKSLLVLVVTIIGFMRCSCAYHHRVGESMWSIPLRGNFYTNWSSNHIFRVGDSLVFQFESGFYDVMQVSRREYEDCTAKSPFRAFGEGPATITLNEEGVYYFVCSLGNYCLLGQKLSVLVQYSSFPVPPPPPPPLGRPTFSPGPSGQMWPMRPITVSSSPSPNPYVDPTQVSHMAPAPTPGRSSHFQSIEGPSTFPAIIQNSSSCADATLVCGSQSMVMIFAVVAGTLFLSI